MAERVGLGGGDLAHAEAGEGQKVEGRIGQGLGGDAEHVLREPRADHRRGEGGAQVADLGQGLFGQADLIVGEALGLEGGVVDRGGLGKLALAQQPALGRGRIGPERDQPLAGGR